MTFNRKIAPIATSSHIEQCRCISTCVECAEQLDAHQDAGSWTCNMLCNRQTHKQMQLTKHKWSVIKLTHLVHAVDRCWLVSLCQWLLWLVADLTWALIHVTFMDLNCRRSIGEMSNPRRVFFVEAVWNWWSVIILLPTALFSPSFQLFFLERF